MQYRFNAALNRYQDERGRIVAWSTVRRARENTIFQANAYARELTVQFREGQITLAQWQEEMAREIKSNHAAMAALAKGGRNNLSPEDLSALGGHLKRELRALRELARGISEGTTPTDGRLMRTVDHYVRAGRKTYHEMLRRSLLAMGYTHEKTVRTAAERSCGGCIIEERRDYVPIGALIAVGDRTCKRNCLCLIYFLHADGRESGPF